MKPLSPVHIGSRAGVTLVEILLAAACLLLLLALAFPAYHATTGAADNLRCVEKLRSLGGAALRYTQDHRGQMPSADWNQPNGRRRSGTSGTYAVRGGLLDYLADWKIPGSTSPTEVAWCPAERRAHRAEINAWQTYCLNSFAKGTGEQLDDGTPAVPSFTISPPLLSIPQKARMAMFMDGVKPTYNDSYPVYPSTISASTFLNRQDSFYPHGQRINVVFMDGHVAAMERAHLRALTTSDPFWNGGM